MYTLVVLCTVVLAFLAMKATLEVQKAVFLSVCVYVSTLTLESQALLCCLMAPGHDQVKLLSAGGTQRRKLSIKMPRKFLSSPPLRVISN